MDKTPPGGWTPTHRVPCARACGASLQVLPQPCGRAVRQANGQASGATIVTSDEPARCPAVRRASLEGRGCRGSCVGETPHCTEWWLYHGDAKEPRGPVPGDVRCPVMLERVPAAHEQPHPCGMSEATRRNRNLCPNQCPTCQRPPRMSQRSIAGAGTASRRRWTPQQRRRCGTNTDHRGVQTKLPLDGDAGALYQPHPHTHR